MLVFVLMLMLMKKSLITITLLNNPEIAKGFSGLISQVGWFNLGKAFIKALPVAIKNNEPISRHLIMNLWEHWEHRQAIDDGYRSITYWEYHQRTLILTHALYNLGLRGSDSVAVLMLNRVEWFELMGACMVMGYKMPLINWHLNAEELTKCVNQSKAKVLVVDINFLPTVRLVCEAFLNIEHILTINDPDQTSSSSGINVVPMESFYQSPPPAKLPPGGFGMPQKFFSGGTTGMPRFIESASQEDNEKNLFDPKGLNKSEEISLRLLFIKGLYLLNLSKISDTSSRNIRSLIPGPLYHGGVQTAVLPFFLGGTLFPMRKFTAEGFLKLIDRERINFVFVAPTLLERVLNVDDEIKKHYNLESMNTLVCAAAPCPARVKKQINLLFKAQGTKHSVFHEFYGGSEIGIISLLVPKDYENNSDVYSSVGRARTSQCKIYDLEKKRWCHAGETGQIVVRSLQTFQLRSADVSDEELLRSFHEIDGLYWYDDGLIGHMDTHGFLYITSRSKEMIICGGVNIYPDEIESLFKQHDAIADVAVIGVPDTDLGEVVALIAQRQIGKTVTEASLLEFGKANGLYGYKLPRKIKFLESFPREVSGKLKKKPLIEIFQIPESNKQ